MIPRFRAWHKPNKIMLDVIAINFSLMIITADIEIGKIYPELDYWWKETDIPFSEIELMQSTGLKDKNGIEIFEGDIVDISGHTPFYNVVEFDKKGASFMLRSVDKRWSNSYFTNYENVDKEIFEIIGNIYENPGLLEVEE